MGKAWPLAGGAWVLQRACRLGGGAKRPFVFPIRLSPLAFSRLSVEAPPRGQRVATVP